MTRDKLMGWLWPERDTEPARRLLNQAVHALRQALGQDVILSAGDELQLNTGVLECDVVGFDEAVAAGLLERAVGLYGGPFLDGFFLDQASEFELWVDRERDRLAGSYGKALEGLAEAAERMDRWGMAVEWWKTRAGQDPYDSRIALRHMQAMERAGNRAGALQQALAHGQLLRQELEMEPPQEIRALVERLRQVPPPTTGSVESQTPRPSVSSAPIPPTEAHATLVQARAPYPKFLRYSAAVLLLAAGIGGTYRLAARSDRKEPAVTSTVADEIAQAVARELDRRRRGDTGVRLPRHRTTSIPAYELYLRGDDPSLIRSDSGARRALEYFRRATALDSNYAAAWVGLARMTYRASGRSRAARTSARIEAEAALQKAVALDDSLPEAHALLGVYRGMAHQWTEAEQHFRRALSLEPSRRVYEWFGQFLLMTGRPAEALAMAERAVALDPMAPTGTAELARALAANDRCEEALARLKAIESLEPPLLRVPAIAARCYARMARWAEAIAALEPGAEHDIEGATLARLGYVHARAGHREEALAIQAGLLKRWRDDSMLAMALAFVPAGLGDRDQAFGWIDSAEQDGSLRFSPGVWVDLTDAPFDVLADDPRMDRLRRLFYVSTGNAGRTGAETPTAPRR
jgi:serine/threonine-protein kinase